MQARPMPSYRAQIKSSSSKAGTSRASASAYLYHSVIPQTRRGRSKFRCHVNRDRCASGCHGNRPFVDNETTKSYREEIALPTWEQLRRPQGSSLGPEAQRSRRKGADQVCFSSCQICRWALRRHLADVDSKPLFRWSRTFAHCNKK